MSYGLNAAQARAKSSADLIVFEEIYTIMKEVINQSSVGNYEASINDNTIMTSSAPTTSDSEKYFNTWQGTLVDRSAKNQMDQVVKYFTDMGYRLDQVTNTITGKTFSWKVYW